MTITLTSEIESALTEVARQQGTTPELLALDCLRTRFLSPARSARPPVGQGSLADYLADHLGVLSSAEHVPGGAAMSEDCGKKFAAGLLQKRQQEQR